MGLTFTATWSVAVHPAPVLPVTVYVIVEADELVTVAPEVALRDVLGDQEYVVAPDAVNEALEPIQIV